MSELNILEIILYNNILYAIKLETPVNQYDLLNELNTFKTVINSNAVLLNDSFELVYNEIELNDLLIYITDNDGNNIKINDFSINPYMNNDNVLYYLTHTNSSNDNITNKMEYNINNISNNIEVLLSSTSIDQLNNNYNSNDIINKIGLSNQNFTIKNIINLKIKISQILTTNFDIYIAYYNLSEYNI
jgi:hypothetical protein